MLDIYCSTNQLSFDAQRKRLQHGSVCFCLIGSKGFLGPRILV